MKANPNNTYSNLSMEHKRKILTAKRLANICLTFLASTRNNRLANAFKIQSISDIRHLSDEEVNAEINILDKVVEQSKGGVVRPLLPPTLVEPNLDL